MINSEINKIQKSFEYSYQGLFNKLNISNWKIVKRFRQWKMEYKIVKRKYHLDHFMAFLVSWNSSDNY